MNGYGERTGNADLIPIAANLVLKMGADCLPEGAVEHLTEVAHYVAEVANVAPGLAPALRGPLRVHAQGRAARERRGAARARPTSTCRPSRSGTGAAWSRATWAARRPCA